MTSKSPSSVSVKEICFCEIFLRMWVKISCFLIMEGILFDRYIFAYLIGNMFYVFLLYII